MSAEENTPFLYASIRKDAETGSLAIEVDLRDEGRLDVREFDADGNMSLSQGRCKEYPTLATDLRNHLARGAAVRLGFTPGEEQQDVLGEDAIVLDVQVRHTLGHRYMLRHPKVALAIARAGLWPIFEDDASRRTVSSEHTPFSLAPEFQQEEDGGTQLYFGINPDEKCLICRGGDIDGPNGTIAFCDACCRCVHDECYRKKITSDGELPSIVDSFLCPTCEPSVLAASPRSVWPRVDSSNLCWGCQHKGRPEDKVCRACHRRCCSRCQTTLWTVDGTPDAVLHGACDACQCRPLQSYPEPLRTSLQQPALAAQNAVAAQNVGDRDNASAARPRTGAAAASGPPAASAKQPGAKPGRRGSGAAAAATAEHEAAPAATRAAANAAPSGSATVSGSQRKSAGASPAPAATRPAARQDEARQPAPRTGALRAADVLTAAGVVPSSSRDRRSRDSRSGPSRMETPGASGATAAASPSVRSDRARAGNGVAARDSARPPLVTPVATNSSASKSAGAGGSAVLTSGLVGRAAGQERTRASSDAARAAQVAAGATADRAAPVATLQGAAAAMPAGAVRQQGAAADTHAPAAAAAKAAPGPSGDAARSNGKVASPRAGPMSVASLAEALDGRADAGAAPPPSRPEQTGRAGGRRRPPFRRTARLDRRGRVPTKRRDIRPASAMQAGPASNRAVVDSGATGQADLSPVPKPLKYTVGAAKIALEHLLQQFKPPAQLAQPSAPREPEPVPAVRPNAGAAATPSRSPEEPQAPPSESPAPAQLPPAEVIVVDTPDAAPPDPAPAPAARVADATPEAPDAPLTAPAAPGPATEAEPARSDAPAAGADASVVPETTSVAAAATAAAATAVAEATAAEATAAEVSAAACAAPASAEQPVASAGRGALSLATKHTRSDRHAAPSEAPAEVSPTFPTDAPDKRDATAPEAAAQHGDDEAGQARSGRAGTATTRARSSNDEADGGRRLRRRVASPVRGSSPGARQSVEPQEPIASRRERRQHVHARQAPANAKLCDKCKELKPFSAFARNTQFTDNLHRYCNACQGVDPGVGRRSREGAYVPSEGDLEAARTLQQLASGPEATPGAVPGTSAAATAAAVPPPPAAAAAGPSGAGPTLQLRCPEFFTQHSVADAVAFIRAQPELADFDGDEFDFLRFMTSSNEARIPGSVRRDAPGMLELLRDGEASRPRSAAGAASLNTSEPLPLDLHHVLEEVSDQRLGVMSVDEVEQACAQAVVRHCVASEDTTQNQEAHVQAAERALAVLEREALKIERLALLNHHAGMRLSTQRTAIRHYLAHKRCS